jgi:eukaryotic-like serine/threonine-protein kinase
MAAMDLSPRAVIAGRYRVDTKVGAGGMGEVWSGEHIGIGVRVAVKTLLPAAAINHEVVARFKREAQLLGRIRSDHVARVVDFIADDVYGLVLVMEFVEGDPLSRLLQEKTLSVEETLELGVDIASALLDLHKSSIIHRDLKPGNIIMAPLPDGRRRAVVVDFGVSRVMNDSTKDEDEELTGITRADMAVGTIEYMAPEQILNSRNVTPGSDIYAAGAILFRAAAGRHVYGNVQSDAELAQKKLTTESTPLPLTRDDKMAQGLARVVGKMLKRRPSERYKSAEEVLADLVPVRDMARGAIAELESTTVDGKGVKQAATAASATIPIPVAGPTSGPVSAASAPVSAASAAAPVSAPVSAPAVSSPVAQATPVTPDATSVTASRKLATPPERRGVPLFVTVGAVAAALAAGVFFGPRLMALSGSPPEKPGSTVPEAASGAATAAPAPSTTADPAPSTSAAAMPSASANAPSAEASAVPSAVPEAEDAGPPKLGPPVHGPLGGPKGGSPGGPPGPPGPPPGPKPVPPPPPPLKPVEPPGL